MTDFENNSKIENIGKSSRIGIYWNVTLKVIHQAYHFIVLIIVARILSPQDFGVMALAMALISYANNLTSFGLTSALIQKQKVGQDLIDSVFTFNLSFSLLLMPISIYLSKPISTLLKSPDIEVVIPVLTLLFPLTTFYSIPMALLRRELNFRLHSIIDLFHNFVQSTTMLILAISGLGVWSLVYGQIAGFIISTIVIISTTKWRPKLRFSLHSLKGVKEYGALDLLRSHISYIENHAAYFIISRFLNPAVLGFFDRAASITDAPLKRIQIQLDAVFFASFSRLQNEPGRLSSALNKSITSTSIIAFPLLVGLAIVTPYFVNIFLGPVWSPMVPAMIILSFAGVLKMLYSVFRNINISINAYRDQTIANSVSTLLYVVLCFLGVKWGIVGIAYATLASSVIAFFYNAYLTSKAVRVSLIAVMKNLIPALTGCLFMALVMTPLFSVFLKSYTVVNFVLLIIAGGTSYTLWILIIPFRNVRNVIGDVVGDFKPFLRRIKVIGNS